MGCNNGTRKIPSKMILSLSSILIASLLSAQTSAIYARKDHTSSTTAKDSATSTASVPGPTTTAPAGPLATAASVLFPAFGNSEITGSLEFRELANNAGIEITSSGDNPLHNFPAGQGPFSYHSIHSRPADSHL